MNGKTFYENTVKLITGRTHQIRAQFSKENLALINDCLYLNANDGETAPPRVPEPEEKIGLHALSLKINAETSLGPKGVEFRAGKRHMVAVVVTTGGSHRVVVVVVVIDARRSSFSTMM